MNLEQRIRWSRRACILFAIAATFETASFALNLARGDLAPAAATGFAAVACTVCSVLQGVLAKRYRQEARR